MRRHIPLLGMAMLAAGISLLAIKDGIAKMLVYDHHPVFLLWAQYAATWIVLAPIIVLRHGGGALIPRPFKLQFWRGVFAMSGMVLFFVSIQFIQLAQAHAMALIAPVVVTALSPWLLGEKVGWRRWVAVVISFFGVLIILRPDFSGANMGLLLALGAGLGIGMYFVCNRLTAGHAAPLASVAHSVAFGLVIMAPVLPWIWPELSFANLGLFAMFFILGIFGQAGVVLAFNYGEASLIAPFHYSMIIASVLFGYFVFDQLPDYQTFSGIGILVLCGVYIAVRESRTKT